jgi:predicted acyl esterase
MSAAGSEIRDGMQIEWDAAIPMDDGIVLRADVFRPVGNGKFPAILNYGPYAKKAMPSRIVGISPGSG